MYLLIVASDLEVCLCVPFLLSVDHSLPFLSAPSLDCSLGDNCHSNCGFIMFLSKCLFSFIRNTYTAARFLPCPPAT